MRLPCHITNGGLKADVIIFDDDVAVALNYDENIDSAPIIIAKGKFENALKIVEIGDQNKIPMLKNSKEAEKLYSCADVGQCITEDLYASTAKMLAYVYENLGRKKKIKNLFLQTFTQRLPIWIAKSSLPLIFTGFLIIILVAIQNLSSVIVVYFGFVLIGMGYVMYKCCPNKNITWLPFLRVQEQVEVDELLNTQMLEINIGQELIHLIDSNNGGKLSERINLVRNKFASKIGFLPPSVHICHDQSLELNQYRILLRELVIGDGFIYPNCLMTIDSLGLGNLEGKITVNPVFGCEVCWIDSTLREYAINNGYQVIEPVDVISTHLNKLLRQYAKELFTRQHTQFLIERFSKKFPIIVDEMLKVSNISQIHQVLKGLLHEHIPIKDLVTIFEAIADISEYEIKTEMIIEQVRVNLSFHISQLYADSDGILRFLIFDSSSEQKLLDKMIPSDGNYKLALNVEEIEDLLTSTNEKGRVIQQKGLTPIIMVDPKLRRSLYSLYERFDLDITVLSNTEIKPKTEYEIIDKIHLKTSADESN